MKTLNLIVLLVFCSHGVARSQDSEIRSISEIIKVMEESEVMYNIDLLQVGPDSISAVMFPALTGHVEYPLVNEEAGEKTTLESYPLDSLGIHHLLEGEPYYQEKEFEEARSHYQKARKRDEKFWVTCLHIGDTYLLSNQPEEAIEWYERASKMNPFDYCCFYYLANGRVRVGDKEGALRAYRMALTLKPRHRNLITTIVNRQDFLDVVHQDIAFNPPVLARKTGNKKVAVHPPEGDNGVWMPYGFAKAVWLGDGGGNRDGTNWSSAAEMEAIVVLISSYADRLERGDIAPDPYLNRLLTIAEDGHLLEFIIYEIGSRMNPDVTLTLPSDVRGRVLEFVSRYVVVSIDQ